MSIFIITKYLYDKGEKTNLWQNVMKFHIIYAPFAASRNLFLIKTNKKIYDLWTYTEHVLWSSKLSERLANYV